MPHNLVMPCEIVPVCGTDKSRKGGPDENTGLVMRDANDRSKWIRIEYEDA